MTAENDITKLKSGSAEYRGLEGLRIVSLMASVSITVDIVVEMLAELAGLDDVGARDVEVGVVENDEDFAIDVVVGAVFWADDSLEVDGGVVFSEHIGGV